MRARFPDQYGDMRHLYGGAKAMVVTSGLAIPAAGVGWLSLIRVPCQNCSHGV
jgi:hypothetical protein